ncbi:MAG: metallophosphoesterase [bacterium]
MEEVKREQSDYIDLNRSEAQNHFRAQTHKVEKVKRAQVSVNKVTDFFESRIFSWMYHYFKSRFGPKHKFQNYLNTPDDNGIYRMNKINDDTNSEISIALAGDWATDTVQSDAIGELIYVHDPDYTFHLGDTYFVGMHDEMNVNFIFDNSSWYRGSSGTFALLGNHEMYSRGISYFRDLLPTMGIFSKKENKYKGQKASYMCLENDHWRIIGLDTGYNSVGIPLIEYIFPPKCGLQSDIMDWLEKTLDLKNDKRGIVFMSHHQYSSAFEKEFVKAGEQIASIIGKERAVLWYWGHEHRLAVYGKSVSSNGVSAYGRCIGHGGMPVELNCEVKKEKAKLNSLVLYDDRKNTELKDVEIGYNGFVILKINNDILRAEYFDIHDELLFSEEWKADISTGNITGLKFELASKEMSVYNNDIIKAVK